MTKLITSRGFDVCSNPSAQFTPREPTNVDERYLAKSKAAAAAERASKDAYLQAMHDAQTVAPVLEPGTGIKHDSGKLPMELLSRDALEAEAAVLAFGANKYAADNWRGGMAYRRLGGAAMRHLVAWLDGEDVDPETGLSHLAHLRCCAGFLIEYQKRGIGKDDRFKR